MAVALCLLLGSGSFTVPVSAARPKNAYDAELGEAPLLLHPDNHEVEQRLQQRASLLAENEGTAGRSETETGTKYLADMIQCKALATAIKARNYAKKQTYTDLRIKILELADESQGINQQGKWLKIYVALGQLETAAEELEALLKAIEDLKDASQELPVGVHPNTAEDSKANAYEIVHHYFGNSKKMVSVVGKMGDELQEADETVGKLTVPVGKINAVAMTAIEKCYSKVNYAKHFANYWLSKGEKVEEHMDVVVFGEDEDPEAVMEKVLAPIKTLLVDLLQQRVGGLPAPTYLLKHFLERCTPDTDAYKLDPDGDDTPLGEESLDRTDVGPYLWDLLSGRAQANTMPRLLGRGAWTA
eukprot:CAMPEP_0178446168 /NCGR_PEP_ID=MMETSP0689_2-20121128/40635_1 /TAXON_ID=160604 /ORGANISM="Amphidinium massartii, Strain CS-259" /LENGTH=357 /DNA_ID=CAMNT_0020070925 /DNA_START=105 /DNA_END=1178 /DNA_ORIENTATION=-